MRYFLDIPRIIDGSGAHPGAASPPVEGCGERDGEESGEPRGARWGGEWGTPWGTVGSAVGWRVGNPVGLSGERRGARRGTPWDSVGSAAGRIAERAMGSARGGWGFCTIRSIATACRRRVASLLVQFPPSQRPERAEPNERAGTRHPPRGARREPRGAPRNPSSRWGFCTIRRIATACRRRVASLLVQFPPHDGEENEKPRGGLWGARWGGEWGTPWGTAGRKVEHAMEPGAGRAGNTAGRPDHALTDSEAGARPRAPPPLGPATSQVSRRSSGRPSVVPDPE